MGEEHIALIVFAVILIAVFLIDLELTNKHLSQNKTDEEKNATEAGQLNAFRLDDVTEKELKVLIDSELEVAQPKLTMANFVYIRFEDRDKVLKLLGKRKMSACYISAFAKGPWDQSSG